MRILLCVACCGFGLYGQFGTKFPQDRMILGGCVVGYFLFSGILAVFDYFIVKSSVICIKIKDEAVHVDLNMQPFDDALEISLRSNKRSEDFKSSVAKYFDSEGWLRQENFFRDVTDLITKFEK